MVWLVRAATFMLGAFWISSGAFAEVAHSPSAPLDARRVPRIEGAGVRVDGLLDEPAWRAALVVSLDFESKPGDGTAPPVATRVLLVHDDHQLYVAFDAADPDPAKIRAHLMDRDRQASFEQDDYVAITLDTFNDSRRAYEFRVNPHGVQMDGLFSQLDGNNFRWDMIWDSAGQIGAGGFQVEIAIPFDQLRFLGGGGDQTWGIGLLRSWPRDVLHQLSAHRVDRNDTCELCQVPRFIGFAGLAPGRNLELTPTLTYERSQRAPERTPSTGPTPTGPTPDGGLGEPDNQFEAGVSLRWGITPSMTLNATYNPDFSQVESDALQLATNQRFILQFPEKRQFFLEGADFFATPVMASFTRTVIDPQWGLKLTGKPTAKGTLGVYVVEDEVNHLNLTGNDYSKEIEVPGKVRTVVGRYRQNIGSSSEVGALYTLRDGENGYQNAVGGVDALIRLAERHQFFLQALTSETTFPEVPVTTLPQAGAHVSGKAIEARYEYKSRNWLGSAGWRTYDENFRADAGFIPRVDFETWRGQVGRTFWSDDPTDFFNKVELNAIWLHTRDQEGRLTDDKWDFSGSLAMPRQAKLTFESVYRDERSGPRLFENLLSNVFTFEMQPNDALRLEASATLGDTIDYYNRRPADERTLTAKAEIKPGIHWNTQVNLASQEIEVEVGHFLRSRLADLQVTWQLNTRAFVRTIVQYSDVDFTEKNDPSHKKDREELASQLLFSYKINPQTLLFVGYSDGYLGLLQESLEAERRTLFVKLSYAFTH